MNVRVNSRSVVLISISVKWLACVCLAALAAPAPGKSPPNIVMIFTDDQGWNDVGCYGSEIPTPNIDALAANGIRMTNFYAASSICTPSRYGLLTGRNPMRSRDQLLGALMFLEAHDKERGIRAGETTYVSRLKEAGYRTQLVGKWHLGHGNAAFWPTQHGFDDFCGHTGGCVDFFTHGYGDRPDWYHNHELVQPGKYATDTITDEAVRFISRASEDPSNPFYLHVSYNAPHFGKASDGKGGVVNVMQPKPADLARVPAGITDQLRRSFAAKVIGMDDGIGQIISALTEANISKDTLVIFMTDHGGDPKYGGSNLPLRGGKATLFDGGLRVPCLFSWPEQLASGVSSDMVSCGIDMFPTLCAVAGLEPTDGMLDGINLMPYLGGSVDLPLRKLFWHTGKHASLERDDWTAVRAGDWKLVVPPGEPAMLFDLSVDPNEANDVAQFRPDELARLRSVADDFLRLAP